MAAARPREGATVTSQGHARTVFRRALEGGNLGVAEATVRELGRLDLGEGLELTALIALHDRERGRRAAMRWLRWWLGSREPTLDETGVVVACLAALGGESHAAALSALRDLAGKTRLR